MGKVLSHRVIDNGRGGFKLVEPRSVPRPYVHIGRSAALALTDTSYVDVDYDIALVDEGDSVIDLTTDNDITINSPGLYMIVATFLGTSGGAALTYTQQILKNAVQLGVRFIDVGAAGKYVGGNVIAYARLAVDDVILSQHYVSADTFNGVVTNDLENSLMVVRL